MVLRYWYVIRSSWPRTAELVYWPLVQMLMWGFLQSYLAETTSFAAKAAGVHWCGAAVGHLVLCQVPWRSSRRYGRATSAT
jgi:hypothetical protein